MTRNRILVFIAGLAVWGLIAGSLAASGAPLPTDSSGNGALAGDRLRFAVTVADGIDMEPTAGRVMVMVSRSAEDEPRFQVTVAGGIPFWGRDVQEYGPGSTAVLGERGVYGYPLEKIRELPAGEYYVQAFLNTYTTFHRSDGSTVQLHLPCGDGQDMFTSPGNLYSEVRQISLDPNSSGVVDLRLSQVIQPEDPVPPGGTCQQGNPPDSEHVKHVKIRSDLLSEYWGQDMYIAANVLLPAGYDEPANRTVRYPLEIHHGHFPNGNPHDFSEEADDDFSQWWLSDAAPRFISVELRHENPYYDDSYAVNSRNLGPYGDAINTELLPEIERRFRTIAQPWARVLTGGSTGGWEALASQIFYPDLYGGAWASCPDSLDFRRHQLINVYEDENAYYTFYDWERVERPSARRVSGDVIWTMPQENHFELALGRHSRSGGQWDIWEAVYGPQGPDGYPARVWDKRTGEIHHRVAEQWAPYDLRRKVESEWDVLGPKLTGKLHVFVGDDDTFFLNLGVALFDEALAQLSDPSANAEFVYGDNEPHCWSPYTTEELFDVMADAIAAQAPADAPTEQWINAAGRTSATTPAGETVRPDERRSRVSP